MSVGAKSIQRAAAKVAGTEAAVEKTEEPSAAKTEKSAGEGAEDMDMRADNEMTQAFAETEKAVVTKKSSAAKKSSAVKKSSTEKGKTQTVKKSVIPSVSPQVSENMRLTGQERYQVSDELPTYLL